MTEKKITQDLKEKYLNEFKDLKAKGIIEAGNFEFLKKLIERAESLEELQNIKALGTRYQRTGFHFDVRLQVSGDETIKYFEKNEKLSFDNGNTTHRLIIGDNYNALTNLLITHRNKIKVIYIDPPYSKDAMGNYAKTNYTNAITRDTLLSMLYNRLSLAKELLREDGVIFCSIDDKNQAYVKCLFDEIFGERNFIENLVWIKNATKNLSKTTSNTHEYILCYAKHKEVVEQSENFRLKKPGFDEVQELLEKATKDNLSLEQTQSLLKEFYKENKHLKGISSYQYVEFKNEAYRAYTISNSSAPKSTGKAATYEILHPITKKPCKTPATGWRFTRETMDKMIADGLIEFYDSETKVPRVKIFLDTVATNVMKSYFEDFTDGKKELNTIFKESPFDNPKPTTLLKKLLQATTPTLEGGGGQLSA